MIDPILSYQSLEKSVNYPVNRSLRIGSLVFSRFVLTRTITKIELIKKPIGTNCKIEHLKINQIFLLEKYRIVIVM